MWSISLDSLLIFRVLVAFFFGTGMAVFLQFARVGQFLARERTWIAVVVGVGADLLIGYQADWLTICLIFVVSSLGIIGRSLLNEHRAEINTRSYKLLWNLEDSLGLVDDLAREITDRLTVDGLEGGEVHHLAILLGLVNQVGDKLRAARRGDKS